MKHKLLLLLLLLSAWAARAQAPAWQSVIGNNATIIRGSAIDANGDYYVIGQFANTLTLGSFTLTSQGDQDMFVAKLSGSSQTWLWAKSGGGAGTEDGRGVAVSGGNVYVTGYYTGTATISGTTMTSITNPAIGSGSPDVYVAKYLTDGTERGALSGGGNSSDQGLSIAALANGGTTSVYVTGFISTSTTTPTGVTMSGTALGNNGGQDIFVARYTDTGSGLTNGGAVSSGTTGLDRGLAIGVNSNGVYVAGYFNSASTVTISGTSFNGQGSSDLFVAKYTATLGNAGAVSGGGAGADQAQALTVTTDGVYVAGIFNGTASIASASLTATGSSGSSDLFLARYASASANLSNGGSYAIRDGGGDAEIVSDIAVTGSSVYVGGYYLNAPTTLAGSTLAGNGGAYLAKYTDTGSTFAGIGAIRGGSDSNTTVSTIALNNSQVFAAGALSAPATFTPSTTGGSITASSGTAYTAFVTPPAPVLSTINPNSGPVGTSVTLTGTNLTGATAVTFGGSSNNTVTSGLTVTGTGSSQTITVNVPSGAVTGNVTVTTPGGTSNGVTFTVIQPTTVSSITRASTNPTNAATVNYTVTFGAPVTGLTASNFTLTSSGISGATVGTPVSTGTGSTWTVPVNTGSGSGSLTLSLANATGLAPGISNTLPFAGETYTIDKTAPTVTISSTAGASGGTTGTTPIPFTVTFSKSVTGFVQGDLTVTNGTASGFAGSGTTYTFNVTPTTPGTVTTVTVPANVAQDAAGNLNTAASSPYSLTYSLPTATVTGISKLAPTAAQSATGTATASVSFTVTFSASVSGVSTSNFTLATSAGISGASVTSVSGSGTTYTVTANTGNGNGTLQLNVTNATGITPSVTNTPFTGTGAVYTITKSFAAAPQLTIQGTGGTGSDVTAFVDVAQVLSGGSVFTNGLRNGSFETHDALANGDYGYNPTGATWTFNAQSGIANQGSAFTPTTPVPNGIAVAFVQSLNGNNGQLQQNLALPTGNNYQVSFQAAQRVCCTTLDQALNVFLNGVFLGTIQPNSNSYTTFTSPTFAVTSPALTATVSTTSGSPTGTSSIPFSVSFSQSVGTTFVASDVTVSGGTLNTASFSGSGAGPYTFTVTPSGSGTVTVSLAAGVATDANNTSNAASNAVSVQYQQPATAAPVVTSPANGSFATTTTPTYAGSAPTGSTVTVYVDGSAIGTTTASGGTFSLAQPTALAQGNHTVYATAQASGSTQSPASSTNTFTIDSIPPSVAISSTAGASGNTTSTSPIPFTVTFSENVTGFVAGDLTVTNGTVSGFAGSGTTYTFNVTPTTAGTAATVTVPAAVAQDAAGNLNTAAPSAYSLTFLAPTITVAPTSLPNGTTGVAYSQTLSASGGSGTYTYAITSGALPSGLTLTTGGTLSGTPAVSGTFNFRVTATDNSAAPGPYSGFRDYSLTIARPTITVNPASLPGGTVGVAYSQALTASGGTGTYTYAITNGATPNGLTISPSGVLSGTPTAAGTFGFTVTTTDAFGSTGAQAYTVVISAPIITVNPASLPGGTQGVAYSVTLSASGGTGTYTYAITNGALPSGLTLTTSGVLSGTPTVNGPFGFTVTARDAFNSAGARSYTLAIAAPAVTAVSWTGAVSTDWFTAGNWSPAQVPDATIDVTIPTSPSGNRFPAISSGTANALNLTVNSGATLTQNGGTLALAANLTNNGTFQPIEGTVSLGAATLANIFGSGNTRFWNLTVGTNGAQSSTSASTSVQRLLTLNGNLATNGNPFTLESNASGTALVVNNGTAAISGAATYQRYIDPTMNAGLGYRHFSAPTTNATVGSLATASFTPVVNQAYNTSAQPGTVVPFPTVYGYDQVRLATATNNLGAFDKGWVSPASLSDALAVGQGYTVNLAGGQTVRFTGPQNNAASQPITLNLSRNAAGTANDTNAGFQLLGNPFPSPLNYNSVAAADRAGLDPTIYVYASTSQYAGNYQAILNGVGGNDGVATLATGQGFFVHVADGQTSATLNLRNSQRVTTYQNPAFYRTAETRPLAQLTLQGTGSSLADNLYVYFENGASDGFEPAYDAVKLPNPTGLNLSTSLASRQLAIDGRTELGTDARTVPLAVGVPAAGTYTLTATKLLNLSNVPVYLRDLQTGALIDLAQQPSYQFAVSNAATLISGRFELLFSPQKPLATAPAALAQQVSLYPNPAKTTAFLELPASLGWQVVTATLVDALGRVVRTVPLPAQGALAHTLDLHELPTGVYALRLSTSAGTIVKRLTVE